MVMTVNNCKGIMKMIAKVAELNESLDSIHEENLMPRITYSSHD